MSFMDIFKKKVNKEVEEKKNTKTPEWKVEDVSSEDTKPSTENTEAPQWQVVEGGNTKPYVKDKIEEMKEMAKKTADRIAAKTQAVLNKYGETPTDREARELEAQALRVQGTSKDDIINRNQNYR
ncbi:MAG: hypothetical protein NTZ44_03240 [Candidatus Nomurabacteria bacterium]|nr:hypothetical protein [Candidatus Nomurabacteria bacterium]